MATLTAINGLGGHEHNPRGNIWLNDESTFGHKLLLKMGWRKGKGLGKNENGIKENIKVKVKSTGSGVGFKDESFFKIQSTEYDSLLKTISENYSLQNKVIENSDKTSKQKNSLVQRSQAFRNRLHYQKFIKGKDLSKYSEKDMKSIFILNKTFEEEKDTSEPKDSLSSLPKDSNPQEGQCTNVMDTYNSSLSISEYFSLKMKEKINRIPKTYNVNADTQAINSDSGNLENEYAPSSTETSSAKVNKLLGDTGGKRTLDKNKELPLSARAARKEKRKRSKEEISYRNIDDTDEINETQKLNGDNFLKPSKKRKKSKVSVDVCADSIISNEDQLCQISLTYSNVPSPHPAPVENTCIALPVSKNYFVNKSKKGKRKHLKMLRSCLKSKSGQYNVKKVSFSENISYKIIDSDMECHSNSLIFCPPEIELESIAHEPENSIVPIKQEIPMNTQVADIDVSPETRKIQIQMETKQSSCSFSDSPWNKPSLSYNPWIESQRQAKKMKLFKNMLKNLEVHDILKSTNLLFIKGYGNWGY